MAGDECFHLVRVGTTQGYNCFLYFHFLPLSVTTYKVKWWHQPVSVVCVCAVSLAVFRLTGKKGQHRNIVCWVRAPAEAEGLPGVCCWSQCFLPSSSVLLAGKQKAKKNWGYHLWRKPNGIGFRFELCDIWGDGDGYLEGFVFFVLCWDLCFWSVLKVKKSHHHLISIMKIT